MTKTFRIVNLTIDMFPVGKTLKTLMNEQSVSFKVKAVANWKEVASIGLDDRRPFPRGKVRVIGTLPGKTLPKTFPCSVGVDEEGFIYFDVSTSESSPSVYFQSDTHKNSLAKK